MASSGARAGRSGSNRFLPPDPRVEEPYRFTPQLALRLGILGAVALIAFGILFFRLWALQVLSGPQYLHAALDNQIRSIRVPAERGDIFDRNGYPLVANVGGTAVQLSPADLPKKWPARLAELRRLSQVLKVPVRQILVEIKARGNDPVTPVTVRESVKRDAPINYIYEHETEFPGVRVVPTFLRELQLRPARVAAARLRLRDLPRPGEAPAQGGLPTGRHDRSGRARGDVRPLPPRPGGARAAHRRLARPSAQRPRAGGAAEARRVDPADARHQPAARGRERDPLRDRPRLRAQAVAGQRRLDRRARPARRLDPRHGVLPDLRPARLHRPRDHEAARGAGPDGRDRQAAELPVAEPRDRRRLPRGLDLEAGHRARRARDAHDLVLDPAPVHSRFRRSERVPRHSRPALHERRPVRGPDDDPADRPRRVVRHVVLPRRLRLLQAATERRTSAPGLGGEVRLRPQDRRGRRPRVERTAADAGVAAPHLHGQDGPELADRPDTGSRATRFSSRSARRTCS